MTLEDMTSASEVISDVVDPEANIIVGAVIDEELEGEVQVTVIATGFNGVQPYNNQKTNVKLSQQGMYRQKGTREAGASIPEFLRLRNIRKEPDN